MVLDFEFFLYMKFTHPMTTQGMLTFEGDATLLRNEVHTDDSVEVGKGGALSNTASGTILFKGNLRVESNSAEVGSDVRLVLLAFFGS